MFFVVPSSEKDVTSSSSSDKKMYAYMHLLPFFWMPPARSPCLFAGIGLRTLVHSNIQKRAMYAVHGG
jgi:hypothetical protein